MANGPKDKLRKLASQNILFVDINDVTEHAVFGTDLPVFNQMSGVMRFSNNDLTVSLPRYRMLVLADYSIYCYTKIHHGGVMDLDKYKAKIEFKNLTAAAEAWKELVKTPIIYYGKVGKYVK